MKTVRIFICSQFIIPPLANHGGRHYVITVCISEITAIVLKPLIGSSLMTTTRRYSQFLLALIALVLLVNTPGASQEISIPLDEESRGILTRGVLEKKSPLCLN